MDEISKLKKIRSATRRTVTKFISKVESEIDANVETQNVTMLEEYLNYLTDMLKELKNLDDRIQNIIIDENAFDLDIESSLEYSQKIIILNSKISAQLKILRSRNIEYQSMSSAGADNAQTRNTFFEVSSVENRNNNSIKTVKLPKLNITKYSGDPCAWIEFWNQFQNSIDRNESLSKIDKFSYLKTLLEGTASNVVNGFSLSEENYDKVIKLLNERFGRQDLVINAHMSKLLNLYPVKDSNNVLGLRKLYDTCEIQIRSLESLSVTAGMYGHLLYPILIKLLPEDLALNFNRKRLEKSENGQFDVMELLNFLKVEIECRESSIVFQNSKMERRYYNSDLKLKQHEYRNNARAKLGDSKLITNKVNNSSRTHEYLTPVNESCCIYCKELHDSQVCENLCIDDKKDILKKQARCFLCLKPNHKIKDCKKKDMCEICNKKHNRSICFKLGNKSKNEESKIVSTVSHCDNNIVNKNSGIVKNQSILLQTCSAVIRSSSTSSVESVRLLLDNGSMRSFITRDISRKLNLPVIRKETLSVYAFGAEQATEKTYNVVKVKLENRNDPSLNIEIEVIETDNISASNLSAPDENISKAYKHLRGLQLADCFENSENKIVVLIGTDFYYDIVTGRIKRLNPKLVATETLFGWCIQGKFGFENKLLSMKVIVEDELISKQLREFWALENLGVEVETQNNDIFDVEVMKEFESGISFENKRYKVKLPWKPNMKELLHNNKEVACRRFSRLRSTFENDPILFTEYKAVLDEYLKENIIEPVSSDNINLTQQNSFYLPHRAVIRNDKTTSRLRIVFDASSHAKGQISLNDCLHTGLNLIPDLLLLLIKFRLFPVAFTADIKQAFLQIEIDEEDRDFTRFLWDEDPISNNENKVPKILRMTRVLFGVKSSPFLLSATVKHHLKRYVEKFPKTFELLDSSLYVDDFISGEINIEQALRASLESCKIFEDASMTLRKWRTNSIELQNKWRELGIDIDPLEKSDYQSVIPNKVLGVAWNTDKDLFYFDTQNLEEFLLKRSDTKRFILQVAGRIFDPVGFIGPYSIRIKCLIQEIWCLGLDWDDYLPEHLKTKFNQWCYEITELSNVKIPRYYFGNALIENLKFVQLHCFSDASKKAYGTVLYLRIILNDGKIISSFVASKSRVAPLKTLSLPRLELMGALLSARLSNKITKAIQLPITQFFWTDSSITFYWIKGTPDRFKVFVKNRVEEIHQLSDPSEWAYCPGKDNPADIISRGMSVDELKDNDLWWHGPKWLVKSEEFWPNPLQPPKDSDVNENIDKYELRKVAAVNSTIVNKNDIENDLIRKYSSFSKLIRISAWCLRFINNCKFKSKMRTKGFLNASELQNATKTLVKYVQHCKFYSEIKCLKKKRPIPQNSKILSLNVFLDDEEILRVGGRLKFSDLLENQKHQLLLPKDHQFTQLLIDYYHKKSFHSGVRTTLSLIRQIYWIPSGQDRVRRVINKCMVCFRNRNQTITQIMGNLPKDRVTPSRPFDKIGLDFAGPIITKPNLKRSKITLKSYIAIFICFCTKATHFEVVSDLSTESFLACLRRFIARRSKPSIIWSDNATNFKGAKNILDRLFELCRSANIQSFSAEEGIHWKFIPPASPHFGGLWEANIKSMKKILSKVTKSTILNYEELTTLVVQIEAILNSRPLTPLSADPTDLQPLTPGHFLVGAPLVKFPEPSNASDILSFSSRWSLIQDLSTKFWNRWSQEYLNELQTRAKWKKCQFNLKEGQLVLLKETNKSPMEWPLGRIEKVFPGQDDLVRVVDVRTSKGIFRRAANKVTPLPDEVGPPSNGGRDART